jgi:hypothetical protein
MWEQAEREKKERQDWGGLYQARFAYNQAA